MAVAEPPAALFFRSGGTSQRFFRNFPRKSRDQRVQRNDFSRPIRQREKLRATRSPELFGSVLNAGGRVVRHHFLQSRQRGQQFGGALQLNLSFHLQILEGQYGVTRVLLDSCTHLFFRGVTHHGQGGKRKGGNQQGQREQEFCAQARLR